METAMVHQGVSPSLPFVQIPFLRKVHWSGLDEASGFCYTIKTEATSGLLLDSLLLLSCSFDSAGP